MKEQKNEVKLIPVNNLKKLETGSKLKKLNDIESIDAFEILDIEEKLDFATTPTNGSCDNSICYG